MRSRVVNGFLVTSILTGGVIQIQALSTPVSLAEMQQKNVDISSSLRQLGAQSQFIQLHVDDTIKNPNIEMNEVPALQIYQDLVKQNMKEWSSELYPNLILLNAKSKGYTNKFNSYYPVLKQFIDNNEDKQGFLDRLELLQDMAVSNQGKIQSHINELQYFQNQLNENISKLNTHVKAGREILSASGSGKIDKMLSDLLNSQNAIQKDLQEIALIPGALNATGWEIFKNLYTLSKDMLTPVAEAGLAAVNKGKEIEKRIVEAEQTAEQMAKDAGKSTQEIELAKKKAREKIETENKGEIAAAAAAKTQEYDLLQAFDTEKIQKAYNNFAELNKLTVQQKLYLNDLQKQNQTIYTLTTKLKIADVQNVMLLKMQANTNTFADKVKQEITLLENYKKDWDQIKDCITNLSADTSNSTIKIAQLKRLKDLNSQFEKQINQFNS